ncbi:hypothetical protein Enr13x_51930 [Stieleria neptunia]|uniref:Uncharacterized protein n=1 Tax=Stieleria neptunia TaxID=2527979 RepID=A0A518HX44_9BACT|nr:hypothetical protein Enr13x_51930 [Stieleria neptunia]
MDRSAQTRSKALPWNAMPVWLRRTRPTVGGGASKTGCAQARAWEQGHGPISTTLVPRLRLGTQRRCGSAARVRPSGAGASKTVCSQARAWEQGQGPISTTLVPRLCLGTQLRCGSVARARRPQAEPPRQCVPRREPGNKDMDGSAQSRSKAPPWNATPVWLRRTRPTVRSRSLQDGVFPGESLGTRTGVRLPN